MKKNKNKMDQHYQLTFVDDAATGPLAFRNEIIACIHTYRWHVYSFWVKKDCCYELRFGFKEPPTEQFKEYIREELSKPDLVLEDLHAKKAIFYDHNDVDADNNPSNGALCIGFRRGEEEDVPPPIAKCEDEIEFRHAKVTRLETEDVRVEYLTCEGTPALAGSGLTVDGRINVDPGTGVVYVATPNK